MLNKKRVAGTVILNLHDGTKKFLLHKDGDNAKLLTVELSEEQTGLASALQLLKEEAQLDVTTIELVELTSGYENDVKVPLFVFEMTETEGADELPNDFYWGNTTSFQHIIQQFKIEGLPYF